MNFDAASLPPLILAVATAVGLGRLLELLVTRRKVRGEGTKVEVDAGAVVSSELRQWTNDAVARAAAAEARADAIEARLTARIEELLAKLDIAEDSVDRLEAKIARCQGGPPCPVRNSGTNPRLPVVTPRA